MAEHKKIGIFLGKNGFSFVETSGKTITNSGYISYDTPLHAEQDQNIPEGLKLTALIKKALNEHAITSKQVNLSITSNDIIFRSFAIPWMQPSEIKNVVDFEATKYIPIPLDNLSYTFHPAPFTENNQKNIRILFVASRKDTVHRYVDIVEHAGLQVEHIEPESVSLSRALIKQGYVTRNQSTAIIEIDQTEGKIIIVEDEVIHFVREFQIPQSEDPASFNSNLFNEIRVSFNYYMRQNPQGKIDKIIILSLLNVAELSQDFSKEFKIPASMVPLAHILKGESITDFGKLNALGATLRDKSFTTKNFELFEKAQNLQKTSEAFLAKARQFKLTAKIVGVCALLLIGIFMFSQYRASKYRKQYASLEQKLGKFLAMKKEDIEKMKAESLKKLAGYKDIQTKSDIAFYLQHLPELLPEGVWLNNLTLTYYTQSRTIDNVKRMEARVSMKLDGTAYHRDPNGQLRLINNLISQLKEDEGFAKIFDNIDRQGVSQKKIQLYSVTTFTIVCK